MSGTVTDDKIQRALNDYNIHLTGRGEESSVTEPDQTVEAPMRNPENWPTNYRCVPHHRPINYNLDRSLRPDGINPVERAFIFTMLHGVWLLAVGDIHNHLFL